MSAIFSQALSGLKSNPQPTTTQKLLVSKEKAPKSTPRSTASEKSDIFSRIKQSDKKKPVRLLNERIKSDRDRDVDITKIHRKTITKDLTHRLKRNKEERKESEDEEEEGDDWKHDKYSDGPAPVENSGASTIFIRNLPDYVDSDNLKVLLKETSSIVGISLERGTAEVTFSSKTAAQKALNNVSGKTYKGNTLKAALVSELNAGMAKVREHPKTTEDLNQRIVKKKDSFGSKMAVDSTERTGKGSAVSILDRIKKRR